MKPHFNQRIGGCLIVGALVGFSALALSAQDQPPPPPPPPPGDQGAPPPPPPAEGPDQFGQLSPIDQLVAPVALYPDPLIALLLPASTEPGQVQRAASYLNVGWQPDQLASQPWSQSVKGIAHYPTVIQWMAGNIQWTQQMGSAFATNPQAVMDSIQNLRHRALAAGTLRSTPQQQVMQDGGNVRILPSDAQVLYVPQYNPYDVYFPGAPDAYVSWSAGYPCGPWLGFYPDWRARSIWVGDWYHYSLHHGGWGMHVAFGGFGIHIGEGFPGGRVWHPAPDAEGFRYHFDYHNGYALAHPHMFPGAPGRDRYYGHYDDRNRDNRYRDDRGRDDRGHDDHDHFPGNQYQH